MTEPSLLLLDEPSSGLDQHETQEMVGALQEVQRHGGTAVLLVEHDVEMVQAFASRLCVLDFGRLIAQGKTAEVMADEGVRKAYLGELTTVHTDQRISEQPAAAGSRARTRRVRARRSSSSRDVKASYGPFRAVFGVSFSVADGGVTALLGANGAGKTTIARVVSGLIPATAGQVIFDGADITRMKPWRIAPLGIVHAPEGRSVFGSLTVEENLTLDFRRNLGPDRRRTRPRPSLRALPAPGRAAQAAGRNAVGWRAAHALARPRARPLTALAHCRRALPGTGPPHHRRGLRHPRDRATDRHHAAAHRAVRRSCAQDR